MPLKTYTNTMHCPLPIHLKTPADFHTHRSSRNRALSTCNAIKNKSHIAETTRYIQKSRNMSLKTCILERETGICKLYRSSSNKKCKHHQKHKIRIKKKWKQLLRSGGLKKKNLKALQPLITLPELLKQQETVIRPHKLHILIQSIHQRLLITEVPHD